MSIRTLAEYAAVSTEGLAPKPASATFEQTAAVPLAALTALQALRKGEVGAGRACSSTVRQAASGRSWSSSRRRSGPT